MKKDLRLNVGSGRIQYSGFINVDCVQIVDGNGKKVVDVIVDIEKEHLPYPDNSVDEIICESTLEHLGDGFIFALNEMHRVLKPMGILRGIVPPFNTNGAIRDITHKRFFVKDSFAYLTGQSLSHPNQPSHPRYSDYGVKPWYQIYLDDGIKFILRPRKTVEYNPLMEKE